MPHDTATILFILLSSIDTTSVWVALIGLVTTTLTGYISFKTGRKKSVAEAAKTELDAVHSAIRIWRETALGLEQQVKQISNEVQSLRGENKQLKDAIEDLRAQNAQLVDSLKRFNVVEEKFEHDLNEIGRLTDNIGRDGEMEESNA